MANPEHLQSLKQGVRARNKWRDQHREIRANLWGANLGEANLWGGNLSRSNISRALLREANRMGDGLPL